MFSFLPLLLLAVTARATILTLQSPRVVIKSSNGSQIRSDPISLVQKASVPLTLSQTDTLTLTFQVVEKVSGKGVRPHQTFLRFHDQNSDEEAIQPVRVTSSGKAKFALTMAKPPLSFPPTSDAPLEVSLMIGSPAYPPLSAKLFDLIVPLSHPPKVHPDEASFHLLPEIQHTFRPDQKVPSRSISVIFSSLVLAPWVVLLGLWSRVSPRVPYLFSPNILPFLVTLGAFEGLLIWYWFDLMLGQVLLYGSVLGIITIFTGSRALSKIGDRRVGRK